LFFIEKLHTVRCQNYTDALHVTLDRTIIGSRDLFENLPGGGTKCVYCHQFQLLRRLLRASRIDPTPLSNRYRIILTAFAAWWANLLKF